MMGSYERHYQDDSTAVGGGVGAPETVSYVTLGNNATLTAERVLTAGNGITLVDAGANLTVTVALSISSLVADATPLAADLFVFFDAVAAVHKKVTLTQFLAVIDHDALLNFVANEHIDHSAVSVIAGTALTGGGTIAANRTLNVDETAIVHDNLSGFVANEHIDHSTVSVIAGTALTGGGTIAATRTLNVDVAAIDHDALLNFVANEHLDWTTDRGATNIHNNNIDWQALNDPILLSGTLIEVRRTDAGGGLRGSRINGAGEILSGQLLGQFSFGGIGAVTSGFDTHLRGVAAANWGVGDTPTTMTLRTIPVGGTTGLLAMTVESTQNVSFAQSITVVGTATAANVTATANVTADSLVLDAGAGALFIITDAGASTLSLISQTTATDIFFQLQTLDNDGTDGVRLRIRAATTSVLDLGWNGSDYSIAWTDGDDLVIGGASPAMKILDNASGNGIRMVSSLVIGTVVAAITASTVLECRSTTGAFLLPRLTTTQRDLLTELDGMMIYNTTTGVIEGREGAAWVNL